MSAKRLSLTASQRETAVGLELAQLLEGMTADGKIDVRECDGLADWLLKNQGSELPAVGHLLAVLHGITADGKVDPEELTYLQGEIERVMPPELRSAAKLARKKALADEKARRAAEAEQSRRELKALAPVGSFDFMVAGVAYDGRAEFIATEGDRLEKADVTMARMPDNPFDSNAVLLTARGGELGYMPKENAEYLAEYLDTGYRYRAEVKKLWHGARHIIPVIRGELYAPDHPQKLGRVCEQTRYSKGISVRKVGEDTGNWLWFGILIALGILGVILLMSA